MLSETLRAVIPSVVLIFSRRNLVWHALAIGLTIAAVLLGIDWWYYEATRLDLFGPIVLFSGLGGFVIPIFGPPIMLAFGYLMRDSRLMRLAFTFALAIILGLLLSYLYKALTGRAHPEMHGILSTDITREFRFGFLRGGVFWGWPSSHTLVAFAGSVALIRLVQNRFMQIVLVVYAIIIGLGASIGFHWLSDVVAGAILGTLVGTVVARVTQIASNK